jgi:hypothetical protein
MRFGLVAHDQPLAPQAGPFGSSGCANTPSGVAALVDDAVGSD